MQLYSYILSMSQITVICTDICSLKARSLLSLELGMKNLTSFHPQQILLGHIVILRGKDDLMYYRAGKW